MYQGMENSAGFLLNPGAFGDQTLLLVFLTSREEIAFSALGWVRLLDLILPVYKHVVLFVIPHGIRNHFGWIRPTFLLHRGIIIFSLPALVCVGALRRNRFSYPI